MGILARHKNPVARLMVVTENLPCLYVLLSNSLEIVFSLFHDDCDAKNFGSCLMTIDVDRLGHEHVSSLPADFAPLDFHSCLLPRV